MTLYAFTAEGVWRMDKHKTELLRNCVACTQWYNAPGVTQAMKGAAVDYCNCSAALRSHGYTARNLVALGYPKHGVEWTNAYLVYGNEFGTVSEFKAIPSGLRLSDKDIANIATDIRKLL